MRRHRGSSHGFHAAPPRQNKHATRRGRKRRAAAHGLVMGAMLLTAQARPKATPRVKEKQWIPANVWTRNFEPERRDLPQVGHGHKGRLRVFTMSPART
jgi:hypothetical protein